ncbi:MAG: c-type cytochrome [Planctomycetaceae bacterium]
MRTQTTRWLLLAVWSVCAIVCEPRSTVAETPEGESSRDVFKDDLAGNADVERIIRTFGGKGAIGDDTLPTAPAEALKLFRTPADLKVELVTAEPDVAQPLFMHFDERGRLWVVQYLQYPFPEGLKVIHYDQYLRAVFDRVPQPPPHGVRGKDKITVFEDTDGDGTYDSHHDVITGLNIATSVITGCGPGRLNASQKEGITDVNSKEENKAPLAATNDRVSYGIYVLNPPYLLFYPDENRDDVPDADPQVLLSGFGIEDTHSVANSLIWGMDGWIYGANGSTTTGIVSSAVTRNVQFQGQCIWRFDPRSHLFEIYAEGGGNTFSSEVDAKGRVFSGTNHGNTRGMYYPQGSYGEKNWGKHGPLTNPFAFGAFKHMPHTGDKDRFAQTFILYEGNGLPARYQGTIIAANALHNRVWSSAISRLGSTYQTIDLPPVMETTDHWFRPVDVKAGPDGAVYIADWYDSRLSHVDPRDNWHKESGRIYRLSAVGPVEVEQPNTPANVDLMLLSDDALIDRFQHPNKWQRQTAARVLGDRLESSRRNEADVAMRDKTLAQLQELAASRQFGAIEAIWTLSGAGEFDDAVALTAIGHDDPDIRRWGVRLLGDQRKVAKVLEERLVEMAKSEPYVQVRSQLASTARRLPSAVALPILIELSQRTEDRDDPHLPLLIWWGIEGHSGNSIAMNQQIAVPWKPTSSQSGDVAIPSPREQLLKQFEDVALWDVPLIRDVVLGRLMQRFALEEVVTEGKSTIAEQPTTPTPNSDGAMSGLAACARLLELAPSDEHRGILIAGFLEGYQGRELQRLPPSLLSAIQEYQSRIAGSDIALGLKLGQDEALTEAIKVITREGGDVGLRIAYLELLAQRGNQESRRQEVVSALLGLLGSSSDAIKRSAMMAMMTYDDPRIGSTICSRYHSSLPDEHDLRSTAQRVLASRAVWTKQFLKEIEESRIKPVTVPFDIVQQMRLHEDAEIQGLLDKYWGKTRATPDEKRQQIARIRELLKTADAGKLDPIAGRELFRKQCGVCHTLFDEGGKTGPALTGYERTNLDFLLLAIVDPSAAIREEFTQFQVVTKDGLVLNGLLDNQTPAVITLRGANNQTTQIKRDDIEILKAVDVSLMPDGQMEKLTDDEVRNLFSYLTRRTPLVDEK